VPPTDHVRTLRDYAKRSIAYGFEETFDPDDADDIADYIEKLEAALRDLSDGWECCPVSQAMRRVARKALEGKDE
jgi:hypothetical protein